MPMFNGEEMRRKLEQNLRRLQIQTQLQATIPAVQAPVDRSEDIEIIKKGGLLLGIDRDPDAIKRAKERLKKASSFLENNRKNLQPIIRQGNFANLKQQAEKYGFTKVRGILFDLGISSYQIESSKKGFSFNQNSPLDMRLDPKLAVSAKDLVNDLSEKELYEIFTRNSQEELARPIAQAIVSASNLKSINTTAELTRVILSIKPKSKKSKIHPATKVFLALRIEVNNEINNLKKGLRQAVEILEKRGRLVVVSFHETEDRIVKNLFKKFEKNGTVENLSKKPTLPTKKEIVNNPRSRSAKLRISQKK
jgi:16S rRNA (cytosine1402-N4)-methyltransferase